MSKKIEIKAEKKSKKLELKVEVLERRIAPMAD